MSKVDLFEVFHAPVVIPRNGDKWMHKISKIQKYIIDERFELFSHGDWDKSTYHEAVAYLYVLWQMIPLRPEWEEIFTWVSLESFHEPHSFQLTEKQQSDLDQLRCLIREKQIKEWRKIRKEVTMQVKHILHIVVREDDTLIGYQKEGCDPFHRVLSINNLDEAISESSKVVGMAEEHWKEQGEKNPAHTPPKPAKKPKEPAKTPSKSKTTPASEQPAEPLPLLQQIEDKKKASEPPAPEAPAVPDAAAGETQKELFPERKCRVCGCTDADCSQCIEKTGEPCHWVEQDLCSACADESSDKVDQTIDQTESVDETTSGVDETPDTVDETPDTVDETISPSSETPAPKTRKRKAKSSNETSTKPTPPSRKAKYKIEGSDQLFDDIQSAMDALGIDKKDRPHHKRWARLGKDLQDKITPVEEK